MNEETLRPRPERARRIVRDSAVNMTAAVLPLVAALAAIPITLREYGSDRYGIILICQVLLGYVALLDFGLGKAAARFLADAVSSNDNLRAARVLWPATTMSVVLGGVVGAVLAVLAPWLTKSVFHVPVELSAETTIAFYSVAASAPFVAMGSVVMGAMDASRRFGLSNLIQLPSQVLAYLLPIILLPIGHDAGSVVFGFAVMRVLTSIVGLACTIRVLSISWKPPAQMFSNASYLFRFAGWLSVSSLANPLLIWLDRLVLGARLSVAAVATYSVPSNLVSRLLVLPGSLSRSLYPRLSAAATVDSWGLAIRWTRYLLVILVPVSVAVVIMGPWLMTIWLGRLLDPDAAVVLRILAIGAVFNCTAYGPLTYLQASGRPEVAAKWHILEVAVYIPLLLYLVERAGVIGAALAWTARVMADAVLLLTSGHGLRLPGDRGEDMRQVWLLLSLTTLIFPVCHLLERHVQQGHGYVVAGLGMVLICTLAAWRIGLTAGERMKSFRVLNHSSARAIRWSKDR